jgi:hypothetical protein
MLPNIVAVPRLHGSSASYCEYVLWTLCEPVLVAIRLTLFCLPEILSKAGQPRLSHALFPAQTLPSVICTTDLNT